MGILKDFVQRLKEKKAREQDYSDDLAIQKRVAEKQKNANERELESYYEEMRQKNIKNQLSKLRKQKTQEMWGSNLFSAKNNKFMFKDKCFLGRYY